MQPLILASFLDTLASFDALIGIAVTWGVGAWLYRRAQQDWKSKSFRELVNFSLNDVRDGALVLRTLHEGSVSEIFRNKAAVDQITKASHGTTAAQPFIALPDDEDWGYVLRACLNVLSERCADVHLAKALRRNVAVGTFVYGLTFENYPEQKTSKFRVILVELALLESTFVPTAEAVDLDQLTLDERTHAARIKTLQAMGQLWASSSPADRRRLRTVELGVPG